MQRDGGCFVNLADYLRRQFAYDEWANREVLNAIRATGGANERSLQLMSHILAAERVWLERLKQQPQSVPVWPEPDLAQCEAEAAQLGALWLEFLDLITAGDVSQSISYKNSKGEAVDEHDCRRSDSRGPALGLSSRADRHPHARQRTDARLH